MLKSFLVAVFCLFCSAHAFGGPPATVAVPRLVSSGPIIFQWSTTGGYLFKDAPRDWEKGVFTFQMVRDGRTQSSTIWEGSATVSLPKNKEVRCVAIRALSLEEGKSYDLWEFNWGEPSQLYRDWQDGKSPWFKPSYC